MTEYLLLLLGSKGGQMKFPRRWVEIVDPAHPFDDAHGHYAVLEGTGRAERAMA
jgi:hypothetical protein